MSFFDTQNPGIGGLDELTPAEEAFLTSFAGLAFQNGDIFYYNTGFVRRLAIGSATQILTVTGGLPSWQPAPSSGGTPGGSDFSIQYDQNGVFGGDGNFLWDYNNRIFTVNPADESAALSIDYLTGISTMEGGTSRNAKLRANTDIVSLGDIDTHGNSTTLIIDDGARTITASREVIAPQFTGPLVGNADTATSATNAGSATTATLASTVTVADAAGDTTTFVMLAGSATGSLPVLTDSGLSYNATTNALTATTFIGAVTGNASTATTLATSRNIWGQAFNGSADVTGSLTAVTDITGGASNMVITAGTGNSRTLTLRTTTSGGTATNALAIDALQSLTTNATLTTVTVPALTGGSGVNWTYSGNWDLSGSTLNKNADGVATITPTGAFSITTGVTYKVVITVSALTVGSADYTLGGSPGTTLSAATTYTDYITAISTGKIIFTPTNTSRLTISSITVQALTDATADLTVDGNLNVRSPAYLSGLTQVGNNIFLYPTNTFASNTNAPYVVLGPYNSAFGGDQGAIFNITNNNISSGAAAIFRFGMLSPATGAIGEFGATNASFVAPFTNSVFFNSKGAYPLLFLTNTVLRMRVEATGNIMIGNTSATAQSPLEIFTLAAASASGQEVLRLNANYQGGTVGSGGRLIFTSNGGTGTSVPTAGVRGYTFGSPLTGLAFETGYNAVTIKMVIDNAGLVGINNLAPTVRLQVRDTAEQLRLENTATKYFSTTVDTNGNATLALTGTTPLFTFSNGIILPAGTATALTYPFKYTSGALLTVPVAGVKEFLTDSEYITTTTGTIRRMIVAGSTGRATAQTAANASVATYTLGATDATYEISANVLVTTSTLHNFIVTVDYTDEGNTARTVTLNFTNLAGAFVTLIANAAGTVPYEGVPIHIRCKASTAITVKTANGGGANFTTVTYNVEAVIKQTA